MNLCNLRFEKIKISEEVTDPVMRKSSERLLLKTLAERALVNKLLESLHADKIKTFSFYKNFFILTNLS